MSLAVLVPSRGRPQNIERLIEAFDRTASIAHLMIGLDADDPELERYRQLPNRAWIHWHVAENTRGVVAWINLLADLYTPLYEYVGTIGDDNVPRTRLWDERVIESLARQGTGFCFADDGYELRPKGTLCTHVFLTADIIRALGYFGPPQLRHLYVDPVWMEWGQRTSIEFLGDVLIEHLHHSNGKAPLDDTYRSADANYRGDHDAFHEYYQNGLMADVQKIHGLRLSQHTHLHHRP